MDAARADDDDRYALRRALSQPRKLAWEFACILNEEARELEAVGVDIIQFDEPAFNVFFDEANDWGIATLERAAQGLTAKTAVHICYGYGIKANTDWKKTLGSEWRQYEQTFPNLQASTIDIVSLECQNSRVPMDLIELIRGKTVMVGAIDVATDRVETPEEVADTLRNALRFVDADKLYPATNCGMAPCRAASPGQAARAGGRRRDRPRGSVGLIIRHRADGVRQPSPCDIAHWRNSSGHAAAGLPAARRRPKPWPPFANK